MEISELQRPTTEARNISKFRFRKLKPTKTDQHAIRSDGQKRVTEALTPLHAVEAGRKRYNVVGIDNLRATCSVHAINGFSLSILSFVAHLSSYLCGLPSSPWELYVHEHACAQGCTSKQVITLSQDRYEDDASAQNCEEQSTQVATDCYKLPPKYIYRTTQPLRSCPPCYWGSVPSGGPPSSRPLGHNVGAVTNSDRAPKHLSTIVPKFVEGRCY